LFRDGKPDTTDANNCHAQVGRSAAQTRAESALPFQCLRLRALLVAPDGMQSASNHSPDRHPIAPQTHNRLPIARPDETPKMRLATATEPVVELPLMEVVHGAERIHSGRMRVQMNGDKPGSRGAHRKQVQAIGALAAQRQATTVPAVIGDRLVGDDLLDDEGRALPATARARKRHLEKFAAVTCEEVFAALGQDRIRKDEV
jgi:hypothetical protein